MAQRRPEEPQRFTEWLQEMCLRGEIKARQLHVLFIRAGGETVERTTERWLTGGDPPASAVPLLLKALKAAPSLKGVDVDRAYVEWLKRFKRTPRGSRGHLKVVPDGAPLAAAATKRTGPRITETRR